jgi:hypothetical protein
MNGPDQLINLRKGTFLFEPSRFHLQSDHLIVIISAVIATAKTSTYYITACY